MPAAAKTVRKQRGRPFRKGQSGNPQGRPEGSRNKATLAMDKLLDGEAEAITRKAIELAKEGDTTALRLCLERLCPPRRDRPVSIDLPEIEKPEDAVKALAAIVHAVASGTVTPSEGAAIAGLIDVHRRTVETEDIEKRLARLERQKTTQ
jgi:hypothetical protein